VVSLRGLKSPYHPTKNGTGGGERSKESGTGGRALEEIRGDGSRNYRFSSLFQHVQRIPIEKKNNTEISFTYFFKLI